MLVVLLILKVSSAKVQPMEAFLTYLKTTTQRELAEKLGCHPSAISQWIMNGQVPAERLFALQRITGIAPQTLRPDLFKDKPRQKKVTREARAL